MEPALLGLVLDSSVLIAAERRNRTAAQAVEGVMQAIGEIPVVLSAISVAEIGHGVYRDNTPELRERRRAFLDELKATIRFNPSPKGRQKSRLASVGNRPPRESICRWPTF